MRVFLKIRFLRRDNSNMLQYFGGIFGGLGFWNGLWVYEPNWEADF
jgi:hypothetical protein